MDREQIKKELVLLIDDMPVELHLSLKKTSKFLSFLKSILTVITTDEQKIFELENRLKECENGYEGTLYLDRCKLHDAEQKIKELTEDLHATRTELTRVQEENERLSKALNTDISIVRVSRGSGKTAHLREVGRIKVDAIRADTVRKMQERLNEQFRDKYAYRSDYIHELIDQTAKEALEGGDVSQLS